MSFKAGSRRHLLEQVPAVRTNYEVLTRLLHEMLKALDYLAFRGLLHRDIRADNILTPRRATGCSFFS